MLQVLKESKVLLRIARSFASSTTSALKNVDDINEGAPRIAIPTKRSKPLSEEKQKLATTFKKYIKCTDEEASTLVKRSRTLSEIPPRTINRNASFLLAQNVTPTTLCENPWLLTVELDDLKRKLKALEKLKPRELNDFTPLARLTFIALSKLQKSFEKDETKFPEGSRIYYFSKRLDVEPALVAKYFSTHLFMFNLSTAILVENLNIMQEFEIPSQRILRDLWSFTYQPTQIRSRLEHCQKTEGKGNLKPWMIRCTEQILQRSLTLKQDRKDLLGNDTIAEYLAERLGVDVELIKVLTAKNETLPKIKVAKIKHVLDYLLVEERFEPALILNTLRVFCHSLETTKNRIEELKAHGFRPKSLSFVCLSHAKYKVFLESWIESKKRHQQ